MSSGRRRGVQALLACVLLLSCSAAAAARPSGSRPFFAAQWEVAKGLRSFVLPDAPAKPARGLIVVKVRINLDGAVVSAKTDSGERDLASVVEPALLLWRYKGFEYDGRPTEVETYVALVYEPAVARYYIQGDHCVYHGPPGSASRASEVTSTDSDLPGISRITVKPDNDPTWWQLRIDVPDNVVAGKPTRRPQPPYPEMARRARLTGEVTMAVVVNRSGDVVYAAPISGPGALQAVSVEAARRWQFTPTTKEGRAVTVFGSITFRFAMR